MKISTPVLLGVLLLPACTATVGGPPPSEAEVTIAETCARTACDSAQAASDSACDRCWDAALDVCLYTSYCDPSGSCSYSCSYHGCSEYERSTCVENGFEVQLPDEDPALAKACVAAIEHLQSCGMSVPDPSACHTYAKVERPSRVAAYDCMAKLACDGDFAACDVAVSTLGDTWCGTLEDTCGVKCEKVARDQMNTGGAWWRDDAIAALNGCLASCNTAGKCGTAFLAAVK